jgi:hypothetical protein
VSLGDEDGSNDIQDDKWYQMAISMSGSQLQYAVNGSTTPTVTITADTPSTPVLSTDRIFLHGGTATANSDPSGFTTQWPSLLFGPMAMYTTAIDLTSSTVRDRIWDANGDFKNPGEDGSLWFGDTYGDVQPEYYFINGAPVWQKGTNTVVWAARDGGSSGGNGNTMPGGLRKQYE